MESKRKYRMGFARGSNRVTVGSFGLDGVATLAAAPRAAYFP
jgi:hypothetical protein